MSKGSVIRITILRLSSRNLMLSSMFIGLLVLTGLKGKDLKCFDREAFQANCR
jgi:hypothetical protein